MRKILFPTDCSTLAHNAFMYAIEVAKKLDAEIDIISIFHLPMADASAMPPEYIDNMIEERRSEAVQQVAGFVEGYEDLINDVRVDYGVFVATEIYEAAGDGDYNMIIMGTKGKHNALERLMGSVTSQVMIHAPCPVLAVPEAANYQAIKKVAYATDFHLKDEDIVLQLLEISNQLGAMVHYVHVDKKDSDPTNKVETIAEELARA
ncbi:MAG: universal stress protein, partial [Bacteroidota bacterium]